MKVLLVHAIVLMAAATAIAYGRADMSVGVSLFVGQTADFTLTEPLAMLLSGGVLLVLASAVRRLSV